MPVTSPIIWIGGKSKLVPTLLKLIPPHETYVEIFGGGGSLIFQKESVKTNIYNDVNIGLCNLYQTIKNDYYNFLDILKTIPHHKQTYNYYSNKINNNEIDAVAWYVVARKSFGGVFNSGCGFEITRKGTINDWNSSLKNLNYFHNKLQNIEIYYESFEQIIPNYNNENTLIYCDPPYVMESRKGNCYKYEMTDEQHELLIDLLLENKSMIFLSGYENKIYNKLEENGWYVKKIETVCHASGSTINNKIKEKINTDSKRVECIWINQKLQKKLEML